MPITKELENLRKFESVGFTHEQAETLTDVIETAIVDNQQSLKEFIGDALDKKFKAIDDKFKTLDDKFKAIDNKFEKLQSAIDDKFKDVRHEITSSELRIRASHTDLLVKILAIAAGCTTIGVAISRVWK